MPTIIKAKIDLSKVHGAKILKKDGRTFIEITQSQLFEGKNGALYLDAAFFPTPEDKYGNDYRITQDLSKDLRDRGERGAILGNAKLKDVGGSSSTSSKPSQVASDINDEDVPF